MYQQFFNLKQAPFSIAPDPRYLFMSEQHREALAHLLYGVGGSGGLVLLTGEIGAGKTTVCRCFIGQIPDNCQLAYIFNPKLSVAELLASICDEFRIAMPATAAGPASVKFYVDAINAYLLHSHSRSQINVLIIDEAQNLSFDVLEQLRLLTNLETNERKLLHIVLIGQPELRTMLARPELAQLEQRVMARYHLASLSMQDTGHYILHRLAVAGANPAAAPPFSRRLLAQIHRISQGVPRRINLLCDRALLGAYVENRTAVTSGILRKAAAEVFGAGESRPAMSFWRWSAALAAGMAGAIFSAAGAWYFLTASAALTAAAVPAAPQARLPSGSFNMTSTASSKQFDVSVRALASLWGATLDPGQPCQQARKMHLRCYQSDGGLAELRLLGRPAVLTLQAGTGSDTGMDTGTETPALLISMDASGATLRIHGADQTISLAALNARFNGEFLTLWRTPASWRDAVARGASGPDVDWLAARLAQWQGLKQPAPHPVFDSSMEQRLRQYQVSQHLQADGVAGPKTLIRLDGAGIHAMAGK